MGIVGAAVKRNVGKLVQVIIPAERYGKGSRGKAKGVWHFPSKSNPKKKYETVLWNNQELTCDCRGWIFNRKCWHIEEVMSQFGTISENFAKQLNLRRG